MTDKPKVVPIGCIPAAIPAQLRQLADEIEEAGGVDDVTLITNMEVYQLGIMDDQRAIDRAVFNMTFGIHRMMAPFVSVSFDYPEDE